MKVSKRLQTCFILFILSIKSLNGFRPFFLLLLPLLCKAFGYNEILKWWIVRICMDIVLELSIARHVIVKGHKFNGWTFPTILFV